MTLTILLACAVAGMLIVQGFFRRGAFLAGEWVPYARRLVGGAVLVALAWYMADGVDRGLTRGWDLPARSGYVGFMLLSLVYGAVISVSTLLAFAGEKPAPGTMRGYLLSFTVLIILMIGSIWLEEEAGISQERSGAFIIGSVSLWIGVRPPAFVRGLGRYAELADLMGEKPLRILYAVLGIGFIYAAVTGSTSGLFGP